MSESSTASYKNRLRERISSLGNNLCAGIDPHVSLYNLRTVDDLRSWTTTILDALASLVPAFKFQYAFFEQFGPPGLSVLKEMIGYAKSASAIVILDAKYSDIPSTLQAYVKTALSDSAYHEFGWGVDAITINPYLALQGVHSLTDSWNIPGKAAYLTMTPDATTESSLAASTTETLNDATSAMISEISCWDPSGKKLEIGMVVSAISPRILTDVSKYHSGFPLLIPGVGAQGGDMDEVKLALARGAANLFVVARALCSGGSSLGKADIQRRAMQIISMSR